MDVLLALGRLVLMVVFLAAGVAKLLDRPGAQRAVADFGVPSVLAKPLAILLPVAEIAVALALAPVVTAWWGAVGALALLVFFIVAIAANLARGRRPACHCFGQIAEGNIGWQTLVRNLALAGLAGVIAWPGPAVAQPSLIGWWSGLSVVESVGLVLGLATLAVVAIEAWLLVQLVTQNGRLLLRIEALEQRMAGAGASPAALAADVAAAPLPGLPVGTPAPAFRLEGVYGEVLTLDALRAPGQPVLLVLMGPECGPCIALLPAVGQWQRQHAAAFTLAVISRGTPEANRPKIAEHGLARVLLQQDREVADLYAAPATPSAVLVSADGAIASPVAAGADAIRALVAQAAAGSQVLLPMLAPVPAARANGHDLALHHDHDHGRHVPVAQVGELAPPLVLPDLDGKTVDLASFEGKPTLVLFWNPGCGFCQQMLDDLKAWEQQPPKDAPTLVVVATGGVDANRALGLRSPVLLEPSFLAGYAFGVHGTPSAVLVGPDRTIASPPAVGAPAVLALARAN
jgi:thiol-disulfide isomerase/thioredoxin/uncharacterized membrane protein YphA (DoxX/SURF4 family)